MRPDITIKMVEEEPQVDEVEKELQKQCDQLVQNCTFTSDKRPLINKTSAKFDSADYEMERQALAKEIERQNQLIEQSQKSKKKKPLIKKDKVKHFDSASHEMEKLGKHYF